jgi:hypothetical protein
MMALGDCTPWEGRISEDGYGRIGCHLAHRRAWESVHGPIAEGLTLDHLCHDPDVCQLGVDCPHRRCVNVAHLEPVTALENKARGGSRGSRTTHCPEGHEYAGDNLLVSGGDRLCRTCRRAQQKARRRAASIERCRAAGHERLEGVAAGGRVICLVCLSERAKRQHRAAVGSYFAAK